MPDPARPGNGPIQSDFAGDPEMKQLIELFLQELPQRIDAISAAVQASDIAAMTRLTHQLRGSSAGYGFPIIGNAAGKVEDRLRSAGADDAAKVLSRLSAEVSSLIDLCRRACTPR